MKISETGLELIKSFEKLTIKGYLDATDTPTIGYGHTQKAGGEINYEDGTITKSVLINKTITKQEAERIFREDIGNVERDISSIIGKIKANRFEFDAFVSLAFNIGTTTFRNSSVLRKFIKGDKIGAANAILLYNKSKGKVLNGLVRRREAEKALFLGDVASASKFVGSVLPGYGSPAVSFYDFTPGDAKPDANPGKSLVQSTTIWSQIGNIVSGVIVPIFGVISGVDWKTILAITALGVVAFSLYTMRERIRHAQEDGV